MDEDMCEDYMNLFKIKQEACGKCMEGNFLLPFFFLMSFIPFTFLLSSWIVAKFVWLPYVLEVKNQKEIEWPEEEIEEIPYEKKYPLEKAENDNKNLNTGNCSVCESTPEGLVFLQYNKKDECFEWWGDNKQVAYKYLETVARKYVTVFKCANLYIDREEDLKNQLEKEKEEKEREEMKEEDIGEADSDDDLFVKFKTNKKIKPKNMGQRAAINGNTYRYCGKIKDFKMLQKSEKKEGPKKMDFSSWKQMFK